MNLHIPTPTGRTVEAQMIPRSTLMKMVDEGDLMKVGEVRSIVRNMNIHADKDGKYFMDYSTEKALVFNTKDDYQAITRNSHHDFVSLIYDKALDRYRISYQINPVYVDELIRLKKNDVSSQYKDLYYYFDGQERVANEYITLELTDGSILKYFHRTETLKQGAWAPKKEDFEYLFKNKLI